MTQERILETLERKLDISYQFKIEQNMFAFGQHVEVRIDNDYIHEYFKHHVQNMRKI